MKTVVKLIAWCGVIFLANACQVLKPYQPPTLQTGSLFRVSTPADTNSIAKLHWTQVFTDSLLQQLINEGIQHNQNLQKAYSVTRQAQAYYQQSRQVFFPTVNAEAVTSLANSTAPQEFASTLHRRLFQTGLTASWEADIWGKLRSAKQAQLAAWLQSSASAQVVQTTLVSDIATNYYYLMALDQQLVITQQSVQSWQATVNTMTELKKADVVTGAAVVQSEASKYGVQVTIPNLKQTIWQTENLLNLLTGRPPGPINRTTLDAQQPVALLTLGVPAQLLANRPDVRSAEYAFQNAFELTNVARTYFYPALTLTGSVLYSSYQSFFSPGSLISNLAAGLTQPLFNQRVNKTRLLVAQEQQQQALLTFQYAVLNGGQEVANALMSYQMGQEKAQTRISQLDNLGKSVNYTQQLVRNGFANYTEVLTAQQSLLTAQLNSVSDRLQQLQAIVYLYRALGGGWQ